MASSSQEPPWAVTPSRTPDRPHRGMRGCLHQPVGVTVTATAPATALRSQGRPVGLGRDSSFPCRFTKWRKHPPDASALCLRPPTGPYARVGWGLCCWASRRPAPPRLLPGCPRPPTCPKGAALPWCPLMLGLPSPPCPTISLPWARDGYILELIVWPNMSQASCVVWRDPRGNPACRGTFGGRRKAVRDRFALQGGTVQLTST